MDSSDFIMDTGSDFWKLLTNNGGKEVPDDITSIDNGKVFLKAFNIISVGKGKFKIIKND